jgi:hypothetical protein
MTQPLAQPTALSTTSLHDGIYHLKRWAIVFAAALILLLGRYDWSKPLGPYSREGYLASAWVLLLLLPAAFYTLDTLSTRRMAQIVTMLLGIICTIPYRWVGLAGSRFWSDTFTYPDWLKESNPPVPTISWFPQAFKQGPVIPHESLVFGLLIVAGLLALLLFARGRITPRWLITHPAAIVAIAAFALILVESWLHLSLRSPYSYQMHFAEPKPQRNAWVVYDQTGHPTVNIEETPRAHGWWHLYLFTDYRGAVNYDYPEFRRVEEAFQGVPPDGPSSVMRRLVTFYLSSQFVCFFNPYYVFIFINTAAWLAAVLAGFAFARQITDTSIAAVFALFIATGSGFIYYANQPFSYLTGYAAVMVTIWLFETLIIAREDRAGLLLFSLLYALALFVSDLLALTAFFVVYSLARRAPLKRTIFTIVFAGAIYAISLGFLAGVARMPNLVGNLTILSSSSAAHSADFSLNRIYVQTLEYFNRLSMDLIHAVLILPMLPAIIGLAFLRDRVRVLTALALVLPCLCTIAVLQITDAHFEDWQYAALPRIAFIAYPAIYFVASIGLVEAARLLSKRSPRFASAAPYLFLLFVFLLNNLDVFGVPALYYYFGCGMSGTGFLPFSIPH